METATHFIERLIESFPSLRGVHREHLAAFGELFPHVFMGDVSREVIGLINRDDVNSEVNRLSAFLDLALEENSEAVSDLIATSFAENFIGEERALNKLLHIAGPHLQAELERVERL